MFRKADAHLSDVVLLQVTNYGSAKIFVYNKIYCLRKTMCKLESRP